MKDSKEDKKSIKKVQMTNKVRKFLQEKWCPEECPVRAVDSETIAKYWESVKATKSEQSGR